MPPLRIIVTGLIAEYPLGGMSWHYLQYLLGLARLGHDVYYIEDSGGWPYDPRTGALAYEHDRNVGYLSRIMAHYGMAQRWAYRVHGDGRYWWFGLPDPQRQELIRTADVLLNVSGTLDCPQEYRQVRCLVYIDTDPVFIQIRLRRGEPRLRERVEAHDVHFSFGECIAESMPNCAQQWRPTRQPVVLDLWHNDSPPRPVYTTVMNWTSYKSETFEGRSYGQKDVEFMRFLDLPQRLPEVQFEIAGGPGHGQRTPRELLISHGWRLVDPLCACADPQSYRQYIQSSRAEWSVAKNAYVQGRAAWFSERSACYLAAGRPVIVQDTGFSNVLPTGTGLLAFDDPEQAIDAVRSVEADYPRHAAAARAVAAECFNSSLVLESLLDRASSKAQPA